MLMISHDSDELRCRMNGIRRRHRRRGLPSRLSHSGYESGERHIERGMYNGAEKDIEIVTDGKPGEHELHLPGDV